MKNQKGQSKQKATPLATKTDALLALNLEELASISAGSYTGSLNRAQPA